MCGTLVVCRVYFYSPKPDAKSLILIYSTVCTLQGSHAPSLLCCSINRLSVSSFFVSLEISLFPSIVHHCRFLYGEYASLLDGVLLPCDHGLDFNISLCKNSINQINQHAKRCGHSEGRFRWVQVFLQTHGYKRALRYALTCLNSATVSVRLVPVCGFFGPPTKPSHVASKVMYPSVV